MNTLLVWNYNLFTVLVWRVNFAILATDITQKIKFSMKVLSAVYMANLQLPVENFIFCVVWMDENY